MKIKILGVIGEWSWGSSSDGTFYASTSDELRYALDHNDDKEVHVEIDSVGGSVWEGLAMYDMLRTSGRVIHTSIIGGCHSIATVILLAAPNANRSGNPNCRALIHKARTFAFDALTGEELATLAELTAAEELAIAKLYSTRTNLSESEALELMQAEKVHDVHSLIELGFVSRVNSYTTNSLYNINFTAMAKNPKPAVTNRVSAFLSGVRAFLSPCNYDYTDAEGSVLFSTASEEDDLAVGMEVTFPSDGETGGEFTLGDGRVVTIEDSTVTEIEDESGQDPDNRTADELRTENQTLTTENEQLREQLQQATNLLTELNNSIGSDFTPANRTAQPSTQTRTTKQAGKRSQNLADVKDTIRNQRFKVYGNRRGPIANPNTK